MALGIWTKWCFCALSAGWLAASAQAGDIVETAAKTGEFKTLVAAVTAAELVETLKGAGPFTVFAPVDAAFSDLPPGTVEGLLEPAKKSTLTGILTYHVVAGKYSAADLADKNGLVTVNGQRIDVTKSNGEVRIDKAKVVTKDIVCDNGIIHVIDGVLIPEDKKIPQVADSFGKFKTLLQAAEAAKLVETLSGKGPLTLFAPTDEAFGKLPAGTIESLLRPENRNKLVDILTYHVVAGRVYSEDVIQLDSAKSVEGSPLKISIVDGKVKINDSLILKTDIDASNGVIHVVDTVLLPPAKNVDARKVLENTVAKGADLYNAGHHDACAKLYGDTMQKLMSADLPPSVKSHMSRTIKQAEHLDCPTEKSWALRHGIDKMYGMLGNKQH